MLLPRLSLFPYTTLFRSDRLEALLPEARDRVLMLERRVARVLDREEDEAEELVRREALAEDRSEEHTSELQSHVNIVCRLLLEKKNRMVLAAEGRKANDS